MLRPILVYVLIACVAISCSEAGASKENATAEEQTEAKAEGQQFGESITAENAMDMKDLLAKLETVDSIPTKVTGTVESVCQAKGCWMNIVSDNPEEGSIFVKFKDYGFFMPLDCAGRKVVMDGYAYKEVTSVDELRHYAEDEGKSSEEIAAITEPVEEMKFMASGVLMLDKKE